MYSNGNFFSEDTIDNNDFSEPDYHKLDRKIIKIIGKDTKVVYNASNDIYLGYFWSEDKIKLDDDTVILPSYRTHLLPLAVLASAQAIQRFFTEVNQYQQNPASLEPIVGDKRVAFKKNFFQYTFQNIFKK